MSPHHAPVFRSRLTTAEILYFMPDHPGLLQRFVWQHMDLAPAFPRLRRFLDYWTANIEGALHSVRVCSADLARPAEIRYARKEYWLN